MKRNVHFPINPKYKHQQLFGRWLSLDKPIKILRIDDPMSIGGDLDFRFIELKGFPSANSYEGSIFSSSDKYTHSSTLLIDEQICRVWIDKLGQPMIQYGLSLYKREKIADDLSIQGWRGSTSPWKNREKYTTNKLS